MLKSSLASSGTWSKTHPWTCRAPGLTEDSEEYSQLVRYALESSYIYISLGYVDRCSR